MFLRQTKIFVENFLYRMARANLSTRLVCISDTHSRQDFQLPDGDILIHAGDLTRRGSHAELERVLSWLKSLTNFRWKIIIAGNHDVTLDQTFYEKSWRRFHTRKEDTQPIVDMFNDPLLKDKYGIIYLQDQMFIDPQSQLKFYGSPWQPEFCAWAFNVQRESERIRSIWDQIPLDTDVLITHGPPYGILDTVRGGAQVGCKFLYERVQLIKPKLHVFGHIHEAYGKQEDKDKSSTIFVNAATCDLRYHPVQSPIVVEL